MTRSYQVGQTAHLTARITDADVRAFAELTGDHNPLHMDEAYAAGTRFGQRVAHGILIAGFISSLVGNQLPGPGSVYLSQTLRFRAPVCLGDVIKAKVEIIEIREDKPTVTLATTCTNQNGIVVIDGEAVVLLPA